MNEELQHIMSQVKGLSEGEQRQLLRVLMQQVYETGGLAPNGDGLSAEQLAEIKRRMEDYFEKTGK